MDGWMDGWMDGLTPRSFIISPSISSLLVVVLLAFLLFFGLLVCFFVRLFVSLSSCLQPSSPASASSSVGAAASTPSSSGTPAPTAAQVRTKALRPPCLLPCPSFSLILFPSFLHLLFPFPFLSSSCPFSLQYSHYHAHSRLVCFGLPYFHFVLSLGSPEGFGPGCFVRFFRFLISTRFVILGSVHRESRAMACSTLSQTVAERQRRNPVCRTIILIICV